MSIYDTPPSLWVAFDLGNNQYWFDANSDGKQDKLEIFTRDGGSSSLPDIWLKDAIAARFYGVGTSKACFSKSLLTRTVNLQVMKGDKINLPSSVSPQEIAELRHQLTFTLTKLMNKLPSGTASRHPYDDLKQDIQKAVALLKDIRVMIGSNEQLDNFDALYFSHTGILVINSKHFPNLRGLIQRLGTTGISADEQKVYMQLMLVMLHELSHVRFKREEIAGNWVDVLPVVTEDNKRCKINLPALPAVQALFKERTRARTSVDVTLDFSDKKIRYDDVATRFNLYPLRYDGKQVCVPEGAKTSQIANEVYAYQVEYRLKAFLDGITYQDMRDLNDSQKRTKLIPFLLKKYPDPQDPMRYYLGIGGKSQRGTLVDFLKDNQNIHIINVKKDCEPGELPKAGASKGNIKR